MGSVHNALILSGPARCGGARAAKCYLARPDPGFAGFVVKIIMALGSRTEELPNSNC